MVQTLAYGERRAQKAHRCFHCRRDIVPGETYGFQTNKYDFVYTITWHLDCEELAALCRESADYDFEEGWGSLREQWQESGEYDSECSVWRGFYPHVIARMELTDQLRSGHAQGE